MREIIDTFAHTSMTLDDVNHFCSKHKLRCTLSGDCMTLMNNEDIVKFTVVVEDVVIHIFDYDY